tara:strand:- start:265 stop:1239 length:975 start_codon:yes stop_codon:yes gene_type:complete
MTSTLITCANTAARPGSPSAGDTVYQEDTKQIITYDGSAWRVYDSDGTGGYALDGSNTLTAVPLFHFDAAKINGTDASGNPSNAAALTGAWTSKINGVATFAQGTGSKQPTWYSSGTSSESYLSSDGGDELQVEFRNAFTGPISGAFTAMAVMERDTGATNFGMGGSSGGTQTEDPTSWDTGAPWWHHTSGAKDYLYYGQTGTDNTVAPTFASGSGNGSTAVATYDVTRLLMVVRDSSNNTRLYVDGNNTNTSNVATFSGLFQFDWMWRVYGSGYLSDGHTYEMALWDSDLSAADKNIIISYANSRYGTGRNADDSDNLARATF